MTEFLIYKYAIVRAENVYGQVNLQLPLAGKILSFQVQGDHICLWIEFLAPDDGEVLEWEPRAFHIVPTGRPFKKTAGMFFVATVQQPPYVWHIYEEHN